MIHDPQINYFGTDVVANIYWIWSEPIIKFVKKFVTLVDKGIKRKTVCYRIKGFAFTFLFFSLFDKWISLLLLFLLFSIKFYALLYTGLPSCLYTKNSPINGKCFCTIRTPCKYRGKNIAFHVNEGSTDYWLSLLVEFEGGDGDVGSMHIKEVCSFLPLLSFYLVYCFLPLF